MLCISFYRSRFSSDIIFLLYDGLTLILLVVQKCWWWIILAFVYWEKKSSFCFYIWKLFSLFIVFQVGSFFLHYFEMLFHWLLACIVSGKSLSTMSVFLWTYVFFFLWLLWRFSLWVSQLQYTLNLDFIPFMLSSAWGLLTLNLWIHNFHQFLKKSHYIFKYILFHPVLHPRPKCSITQIFLCF